MTEGSRPQTDGGPQPIEDSARTRVRIRRRTLLVRLGFLGPFFTLFALFFVVPIISALYQSMFRIVREDGIFGEIGTRFVGLEQYAKVLTDPEFLSGAGRVVLFTLIQTPLMVGGAVVLALLLDAASPKVAAVFRSMYFLPYAVPGVIAALMWGFLYLPAFSPLGNLGIEIDILGTELVLPAMANIGLWTYAGYNVILVVSALSAIPEDLFEAARIDGASSFRIAVSIKVPFIMPTVYLASVFTVIGALQWFTEPQVLQRLSSVITSGYTPNMLAYSQAASNNYNYAAAVSVTLAAITFVMSIGFMRLMQRKAF
ncbi:carbohydrate ABC transporter permease [Microbacterium sp. NPDC055903]